MSKKIALFLSAILPMGAQAAIETWNASNGSLSGSGHGNTLFIDGAGASPNDNDLRITGWADTGGSSDNIVQNATIGVYSGGIGVTNRDGGDSHTIDNFSGGNDSDMVLLTFDEEVTLEGINIGYTTGHQSDVTVVGYTGNDSFNVNANSDTWSSIQQSGPGLWQTVAELLDVSVGYQAVNASFSSKYWFVGACNHVFNANYNCGGDYCTTGGFKLASVTGSTTPGGGNEVPAPASLLLVLAGLLSMRSLSRKKSKGLAA